MAENKAKSKKAKKTAAKKERADDNVVYVGSKPVMNYVLAITTQLNGTNNDVILKARGRAISRAVDAVEIVRRKFIPEAKVKGIEIGTEEVKTDDGATIKVSSIEISVLKE